MTVTRYNSIGLKYSLTDLPSHKTGIKIGDKELIVNHSIETILVGWYKWQVTGEFVQVAFPMLNSIEREFLITGLTEEQWNKIFPTEE